MSDLERGLKAPKLSLACYARARVHPTVAGKYVSDLERGLKAPTLTMVLELSKALKTPECGAGVGPLILSVSATAAL